jgi:hypothetical protein
MALHKDYINNRWYTISFEEQMGNVGSEVGRALKRHQEGDRARFQSAFERALELLDLTGADTRWRGTPKLQEILRVREVFCDYFFGGNQYGSTPASLDGYFFHYAMAARISK